VAQLKFYTLLREKLSTDSIELEIADKTRLEDVIKHAQRVLGVEFLDELKKSNRTMILVNGRNIKQLDGFDTAINNADRIDIFPPAGGG